MKIRLSQVIALSPVYADIKATVLPPLTAYKFTKFFNSVQENATFYSNELNKIINEYAEKDADGNVIPLENGDGIKLQHDKIKEAQIAINDLMNLMVDIIDIKFSFAELEKVKLSLEQFELFLPFIADEEKDGA